MTGGPKEGHILVVDDNRMNRLKLSLSLEQQGHSVGLAEDGVQALEMVKSESFDAVLLDIVMPRMDGYQVLEQMKSDPQLRDIPVIVISAVDEMDERRPLHRDGRRGLPAQELRSGVAARSSQRKPPEEEAARPGEGLPPAGGNAAAEREAGHPRPAQRRHGPRAEQPGGCRPAGCGTASGSASLGSRRASYSLARRAY